MITQKMLDEIKGVSEMNVRNRLIEEIQSIRYQNNMNWMNLVRLAFEVAPERAKEIMRKISERDAEILELSKQLAEND